MDGKREDKKTETDLSRYYVFVLEHKRNIFHLYPTTKRNKLLYRTQIFLYTFCKTHIIFVFKILAVALKFCV